MAIDRTEEQIIEKTLEELRVRNFMYTDLLLEVHELLYEEGRPKILRVDRECTDGTAVVYLAIKDEVFYLCLYLDTQPNVKVRDVQIVPAYLVTFIATSPTLRLEDMTQMTSLQPTRGFNKRSDPFWARLDGYHCFQLEVDKGPGSFSRLLLKLLSVLESDPEGVRRLVAEADGHIQVAAYFYSKDSGLNKGIDLGELLIDHKLMKRIAALDLDLRFELNASGHPFNPDNHWLLL